MFVDFGMAARYGGVCYLRYDDTNPNAEKQVGPRARSIMAGWCALPLEAPSFRPTAPP
jgi:glutamyl/glutaminyl-tRNA synthetase